MLAVPTKVSKGVLVSPTVFGNVMVGPTAEDVAAQGRHLVHRGGPRLPASPRPAGSCPALLDFEVTAVYVGLRAATEHADFQIAFEDGYACVGGIRSTGLSASMAIAEHVRDGARSSSRAAGLTATAAHAEPRRGASRGPTAQAELIERDPDYGRVVCFCERVTSGEIRDALAGPIPPVDLDGLRRRTRAHMGRCQGFFCGGAAGGAAGGGAGDG